MSEDLITHKIMMFLQENKWTIFQYHSPGGQAGFNLIINGEVIFPDIIAFKNPKILVIENKSSYSKFDVEKLENISRSVDASKQIITFIKKRCHLYRIHCDEKNEIFYLHGFGGKLPHEIAPPHQQVSFLIVDGDEVNLIPSEVFYVSL